MDPEEDGLWGWFLGEMVAVVDEALERGWMERSDVNEPFLQLGMVAAAVLPPFPPLQLSQLWHPWPRWMQEEGPRSCWQRRDTEEGREVWGPGKGGREGGERSYRRGEARDTDT